jgi:hypothetical protein
MAGKNKFELPSKNMAGEILRYIVFHLLHIAILAVQ